MQAFDKYGLSNREKQAAYGWLMNYSALRIANEMGITEGTVRNLIKRIYAKTKISDKGQFITTFVHLK
ncbi:helix-turn-helix transcriptional regulator [Paenibacillus montanisoli]